MKKIKLSNCNEYALVDDEDYESLIRWSWRKKATGYAVRTQRIWVDGKETFPYHSMQAAVFGIKEGFCIDHINRDRLDNRKENLRHCTRAQNMLNAPRKNKNGFRGVKKEGNRYSATLGFGGTYYRKFGFLTPEDAAKAYDDMAKEHHGQFAMLNFQSGEII